MTRLPCNECDNGRVINMMSVCMHNTLIVGYLECNVYSQTEHTHAWEWLVGQWGVYTGRNIPHRVPGNKPESMRSLCH